MDKEIPESDVLEGFPHPRDRTDLVGHDGAEQQFLQACRQGRLHHAWILGGPRGIGKATLAYRMARFALRHGNAIPGHADSLEVDPGDPVARRVSALGHADLLVLRRPWDSRTRKFRTTLPVDEVRRTNRFFGHTSGEGGWRICIVDSVDEMNANAANALLKILEEPPERALFLLISHLPGRLLPTIRSRCGRIDLAPLAPDDAVSVMDGLLGDDAGISPEDIRMAALVARGSVGEGLRLIRSGGLDLYRQLVGLMASLPDPNLKALHGLADRLSPIAAIGDYTMFMQMLTDWLAAMVRCVATSRFDLADPREEDIVRRLAKPGDLDRWAAIWDEISRSLARANALNLDRKQTLLTVFFRLAEVARAARAA